MPEEVSPEEVILEAEEKMQKSVDAFKRDLATVRTARATPQMLDGIQVEYYGAPVPLNQVASLSIPEARMILLSPFDKTALGEIEKAILKSDLNLTPQNDGSIIRIVLPELSMERRQELVKHVKGRLEEARVSIRNVRRDANDHLKKLGGIPEDDLKAHQDDVQKLTDRIIGEAEKLASQKEESILTV
ncbi:MAG: ribosome recycling factor [Leptospiraceae bacterium]|nr:ribosome recycling factor [Leptospiraceae bacterium]